MLPLEGRAIGAAVLEGSTGPRSGGAVTRGSVVQGRSGAVLEASGIRLPRVCGASSTVIVGSARPVFARAGTRRGVSAGVLPARGVGGRGIRATALGRRRFGRRPALCVGRGVEGAGKTVRPGRRQAGGGLVGWCVAPGDAFVALGGGDGALGSACSTGVVRGRSRSGSGCARRVARACGGAGARRGVDEGGPPSGVRGCPRRAGAARSGCPAGRRDGVPRTVRAAARAWIAHAPRRDASVRRAGTHVSTWASGPARAGSFVVTGGR